MELPKLSSAAQTIALVLDACEKYRGKPAELRAIFDAALRLAFRVNTPDDAFDQIIENAISHASLRGPCLTIVAMASLPMQRALRHAFVVSGRTMDAIEIAAIMKMPLTREELVLLGGSLAQSHEPLISADALLGEAQRQQLSGLDMKRLRLQIAEIEWAHTVRISFSECS